MRIIALILITFASPLLLPQDKVEKRKACDLKTIESTTYCEDCDALDPELDMSGVCAVCESKPTKVDACIRHYYTCGKCERRLPQDEPHCKGAENKKVTDKARIVFRCEACGDYGDKEGADCHAEECRDAGKKVRKTCEGSEIWPHGGRPPKKE